MYGHPTRKSEFRRRARFPRKGSGVRALAFGTGLLIMACGGNAAKAEDQPDLRVTDYQAVLFGDDHTSEGFLAPLNDGRIMLIFRLDPGLQGSHVGTNGYIARITYDPRTDQWGEVESVYNSHEFDDRNVHGGTTNEGRIVVFFRSYDGRTTRGRYFIYSDDNGQTWSDPQTSEALTGIAGTGQMFHNPDIGKYCILQYQRHRNDILYSDDGASWNDHNLVAEDEAVHLTEIAGAWCGDGRIIALIRDDQRRRGHPLLQVSSRDNGQTWSKPEPTNIPPDRHWGGAPQLIHDRQRDMLIALNSDRYSRPDSENSLFIYTAKPSQVIGDPDNWTLQHELTRPWAKDDFDDDRPLNMNLYGYPTIAPINENEYLVVFTERARMHGTEQADLYYFRLVFEQRN